jgi:hypothetical protein
VVVGRIEANVRFRARGAGPTAPEDPWRSSDSGSR